MKKLFTLAAAALVALSASADYYLAGGFNNWTNPDENAKFTAAADGTYTFDYNGSMSGPFKITNGTWTDADCFGSNGSNIKLGEAYTVVSPAPAGDGGNIMIDGQFVNPHFVFNPTALTLTVTGQSSELKVIYALHGAFFGGTDWTDINMTQSGDNWVVKDQTVSATEFGIKSKNADSGAQIEWFSGVGEAVVPVVLGQAMTCTNAGGFNFSIEAGTYDFTFNPTAMTLTVTQGNGGTPDNPSVDYPAKDLYLVGENYGAWAEIVPETKFTQNGNVFTLVIDGINAGTQGWKIWDGTWDFNFGAGDVTAPELGVEAEAWFDGQANFTFNSTETIKITLTVVEGSDYKGASVASKIMFTKAEPGAINIVNAENGEASYYNLQGVRVANPENGIFIRVQNGKATKVAF